MVKVFNGIPIFINNSIIEESKEENYYISYNPCRRGYGVDTTALVVTIENKRMVFYILKGNHSEQYKNCKNLKDCINYLVNNKELMHDFSDKFEHEYLLSKE